MNKEEFEVIRGRIFDETRNIGLLLGELKEHGFLKKEKKTTSFDLRDSFTLRAIGSILHDFYVGIENIFKVIARDIDKSIPEGNDWHIILIKQMSVPIRSKRPAVIKQTTVKILSDYRGFRHVFRNVYVYGFVLSPQKITLLVESLLDANSQFQDDLDTFLREMDEILFE